MSDDTLDRPPTVGPVPDAVPREAYDRPWSRTLRAIDGGRASIPTIPPGRATAPGRMQAPYVEPDHLTPAAMRLLSSGVGAMREIIGDGCTSAIPPLEVAYLDHGRFSVAIVLTGPVARLNEYAATEALSNGERRVLEVLTAATWMSVEEVAAEARMDRADTLASLRALWRVGLAIVTAGQWRRAEK